MKLLFEIGDPTAATADALIVPVVASGERGQLTGLAADLDQRLDGQVAPLAADARFNGGIGKTLVVPTLGRLPARRLILTGVGAADQVTAEAIRRGWAAAALAAREAGAETVCSALPPSGDRVDATEALAAAAEAVQLATYRFTKHYGAVRKEEGALPTLNTVTFTGDGLAANVAKDALARANAVATGVTLARDLVNEPASVLNPATMVEQAEGVASDGGLVIEILDVDALQRLGAGAILAVGKGSAVAPRLIHLTYRPETTTADTRQIGLVGKCITFDTGGYSIKPYEGMLTMKGDMAGGAAVLGAMSALRALGCRHVVHGVICAAENMISGVAFRPGDVLTAMNGVTIEVLSTDAEGRLVLADGLVYTAREGAQELIDLATLTGAASVALADTTALFANDDGLAERLLTAAGDTGERMWRMPLTEELNEKIKGDVADIKNTGGRPGGAITAALFLQHFSEGLPWAHLDIAGSARSEKVRGYTPKGPTGTGVRTLLAYLTG